MLLAVCMVLSFMPRTAAAQETRQETLNTLPEETPMSIIAESEEEDPAKIRTSPMASVPKAADLTQKPCVQTDAIGNVQPNADPSPAIQWWVSLEGYGDAIDPDELPAGKRYYFNYQLYDANSGYLWDGVATNDYEVTLALYDYTGEAIFELPNDTDSNWVSLILFEPGDYHFRITITGDFQYEDDHYFVVYDDPSIYDNAEIHADPTQLSLDIGASGTITVWATGDFDGEAFSFVNSNSNVVNAAWGSSRVDDRTWEIHLTALAAGTSTLTIRYIHNVTEEILDAVTVNITVSSSSVSTYTVSFEVEGGSNAPSPITADPGSEITIPSNVPTFSTVGRAFTHWEAVDSMGNTISVFPGGTLAVIEDLEFLAAWIDAPELDVYSLYGSDIVRTDSQTLNFPGQYYYYCFYPGASQNTPIEYQFEGVSSVDNRIYLYDSTGSQIASDDDSGDSNQFLLRRTFTDNNLYYIKVQMYNSSATGTIEFEVSCLTEPSDLPEPATHTVSFVADGGTGAPASMTVSSGSEITIPSNVPISSTFGDYFWGWYTYDIGNEYYPALPGDTITVNNDIVFEANWHPATELDIFSLFGSEESITEESLIYFPNYTPYYTFNPGGSSDLPITYRFEGIGDDDNQVYLYDSTGTQLAWDDDDSPNGTQFLLDYTFDDDEQYYLMVRMYGNNAGLLPFQITCLTEGTVYTLTYSDPYSSTNRTDECPMNGTINIVEAIPFHVGKTFLGWGTEDSEEVIWIPGDDISLTEDMTIYAKYQDAVAISPTTTFTEQSVSPVFAEGHYWFTYTPRVSTSYQFQDLDSNSDTYVAIYDASETLLVENDDNDSISAFRAATAMSANTVYYIGVVTHDVPAGFHMLVDRGYRITYNANGGTNAPAQTYVYSEMGGTLSEDIPTRDGYRFLGWATTAAAATARYTAGEQVDIDTNTVLYAVWQEDVVDCTHRFGEWVETTAPSCEEPGEETRTCELCGETETREVPALGHDYQDGECTRCHEEDPNPNPPVTTDGVIRLAGSNRYATGFAIADQLKDNMGIRQFRAVVVAYGLNFPDALTGSYLAAVKDAPILLTDPSVDSQVLEYLRTNLVTGGKIYILGGEAAVSRTFEVAAQSMGFDVKRLKGAGRYETNLAILREAGVSPSDEILIATGKNYADSLSASATGLPMLLVDKTLTDSQREFLQGTSKRFVILGGTGAVSAEVEAELNRIGTAVRVKGANRYLTSVLIANRYFPNAQAAVLAYAQGFPDGLCGGPLAMSMGAPLILTSNESPDAADGYIRNISSGAVTGGTGRISDDTVRLIFDLPDNTPLPKR